MKIYKKIAISLLSIMLLAFFLIFVINFWVEKKLNTLLLQDKTSTYSINYKKLDISILSNSIYIDSISIIPKKNNQNTNNKTKIFATISTIEITNIGMIGILFKDKITAENIIISNPKITFLTNEKTAEKEKDKALQLLKKTVLISAIYLKNAEVRIVNETSKKVLFTTHNLNITLNRILLCDETATKKIPFLFKSYSIECDRMYYHANEFYDIKSKKITITNTKLNISDFKLIPLYNRKQFVSKIAKEKDLFDVSSRDISINDMNWGFKDSVFFFNAKEVLIDKVVASIYRSKEPKDDLSKKKLYNRLLRDLKFNLHVDTFRIRHSFLIYEEEIASKNGSGKLIFDKFNLTATNIQSGFNKTKLPDLTIAIDCKFMRNSPLHIHWKFNVMDKTDGFKIQGSITNLNLEKLNPFTKPYINLKTEGIFDKVEFNFVGDNISSSGKFSLEYDDLKVIIFKKKDRNKINKFLSAIGNLFVKNDTNDKLKSTDVQVKRIQEKSFYNYLWLNITEGLKKLLI